MDDDIQYTVVLRTLGLNQIDNNDEIMFGLGFGIGQRACEGPITVTRYTIWTNNEKIPQLESDLAEKGITFD